MRRSLNFVLLLFLVLAGYMYVSNTSTNVFAANPGEVVINELMYHPQSGNEDDEFLELHNTTGSSIDLSNWCFTDGIELCFDPGTSIDANGYLVISGNSTQTQATYSLTPSAVYTGRLSNGGERLVLEDALNNVIDEVEYDDSAPWPASPDGSGPSLELKDPLSDNSLPASWRGSLGSPTPAGQNSWVGISPPDVENVSQHSNINPSTSVNVTAEVSNAVSVNLVYRVQLGSEITVPMYDNGSSGDGAPADGTYGASIPGQAAGQFVRYKVVADDGVISFSGPSADDSIEYYGYVVNDSSITTQLPLLKWMMTDFDYNQMDQDHREDDQAFPVVLAYGNQFFDNTSVSVYGDTSNREEVPKVSLNFELPRGYRLTIPGKVDRPLDEFNLENDIGEYTHTAQPIAWRVARDFGVAPTQASKIRLDRNGAFHGIFTLVEKYNSEWREEHNYESGAFYKEWFDKQTREDEDKSDVITWRSNLENLDGAARREYVFDSMDIPNMLNFMAFQSIVQNHDWHSMSNTYQYRDTNGTGRWSTLPWDLDLTYSLNGISGNSYISPYDRPDYIPSWARWQTNPIYLEPDLREAYFRRLRTMVDELYSNDQYLQMFRDEFDQLESDLILENQKWWPDRVSSMNEEKLFMEQKIKYRKGLMLARYRLPWAIPEAQPNSSSVDIIEVENGNTPQEGYIKLKNSNNFAVDISGWTIEAYSFTFRQGSVIPSGAEAVITRSDTSYRSVNPGSYNLGEVAQDITQDPIVLKRGDGSTASNWP